MRELSLVTAEQVGARKIHGLYAVSRQWARFPKPPSAVEVGGVSAHLPAFKCAYVYYSTGFLGTGSTTRWSLTCRKSAEPLKSRTVILREYKRYVPYESNLPT